MGLKSPEAAGIDALALAASELYLVYCYTLQKFVSGAMSSAGRRNRAI
jgi:hypothetical protein